LFLAPILIMVQSLVTPGIYLQLPFRENFYWFVFIIADGMFACEAVKQARLWVLSSPVALYLEERAVSGTMMFLDCVFYNQPIKAVVLI